MKTTFFVISMVISINIVFAQNDKNLDGIIESTKFKLKSDTSSSNSKITPFVIKSFPSPNSSWIGDIASDGENIWVGTNDSILYKISTQNGNVLDTIRINLRPIDGLTFDGKFLWGVEGGGSQRIFKVNPSNHKINYLTNNIWFNSQFTHGMLYKDNKLYFNLIFWGPSNDNTYITDTSLNIIGEIKNGCKMPHALTFDGSNYWITSNGYSGNYSDSAYIIKLDTNNFSHIDSIPAPGGKFPIGITFDGKYLWVSNAGSDSLYQIDIGIKTNISNINNTNLVKLYPNPAINNLVIMASINSKITIYNCNGQIFEHYNQITEKQIVDISRLSCGVYYIKIQTDKGTSEKIFIKQ